MSMPFRVLIADQMSPRAEEILSASAGIECDVKAGISAEELMACIGEYDGLLIRSRTTVTEAVMAVASRLKVIGRAGIGVDNVDVEAATRFGIIVQNAPNGNAITTAEHAICLLLSMVRNIPKASASMKQDKWEKSKLQGTELYGKNFGVIGLGNIGKIVAELATGLRMKVLAFSPSLTKEAAARLGVELVGIDELLTRADFVSIHTPLTDSTRGLIGAEAFAKMKNGAFLVNAARGGVVDEGACLAALESGKLAGAAFDVFVEEPVAAGNALVKHPNFVGTPHLGASTGEAQVKVAIEVAEQMRDFAEMGVVRNALNAAAVTGEMRQQLSPWMDLSNKLGSLLGQLSARMGQGIEAIEVEVVGEAAEQGVEACADQSLVGLFTHTSKSTVNDVNCRLVADERQIKVSETRTAKGRDLTSAVRVTGRQGADTITVIGTLFHMGDQIEARVVQINDFLVELAPVGNVLVIRNQDKPGVIGAVGSLLGAQGINVNSLHVAHDRKKGIALALWSLETDPGEELLASISKLEPIASATVVTLD